MYEYSEIENAYQDIFDQYVDVASFLWILRSIGVHRPHYSIQDIKKLERRIQSQLDGLMTSVDSGWKSCDKGLEIGEAGEVFTATVFAIRSHDISYIRTAVEIGLSKEESEKGLISAMGWLPENLAHQWIEKFLNGKDMRHKYLGVAGCSVRRFDPGVLLTTIATRPDCREDARLHARVLRLIGELRRQDLMPVIKAGLRSEEVAIKFWACWSALLLGDISSIDLMKRFVFDETPYQTRAVELVFRILPIETARNWVSEMVAQKVDERLVVKATGVLGDPHAVNWLVSKMKNPDLSRIAGEAFSMITGVNFEQLGMIKTIPQINQENDEDDSIELTLENDLQWPDAEKVTRLWQQYGKNFIVGKRYFMGRPISMQSLNTTLLHGLQRQREYAAMELAVTESGYPLVNTSAKQS